MPVVARPPQRREPDEPSGLEQVLSGLGQVTGIASRVADFIQNRRFADIQESRLALQQERLDRDQATRVLAMGFDAAKSSQIKTLAEAARGGEDVPVDTIVAAPTLGEIPNPVQRESARKALSNLTGVPAEEIDNNFILSPTNIQGQADEDLTDVLEEIRRFRGVSAQLRNIPGMEEAAEVGEAGAVSGVTGVNPSALARQDALQRRVNELLRLEEGPEGQLQMQGPLASDDVSELNRLLSMIGEEPLPVEFDPSQFGLQGPSRMVDPSFFSDLYQSQIKSMLSSQEDREETINDAAQNLSERLQIPFSEAKLAVQGRVEEMSDENEKLHEHLRAVDRAAIETVASLSQPMRELINLGRTIRDQWGVPSEEMVPFMTELSQTIREQAPPGTDVTVIKSRNAFERILNRASGGTGASSTFETVPGTGGDPDQQTGREAAEQTEEVRDAVGLQPASNAVDRVMERAAQRAAALDGEEDRRNFLERLFGLDNEAGSSVLTIPDPTAAGDSLNVTITRDQIDGILEQANTINPINE